MALEKFRTLSRRPQHIGTTEVLLSGIICVSLNQKKSVPKFVEVTHNAEEDKTALYIHKNRDKKKTEAAIDLREAKVFIEYETAHVIGIITRDNRIYTLELEKDREDLARFIAQWRSVFTVSQNPSDMFSVITVSGEDRGSVILITAPDSTVDVTFKHMSGRRKNAEIRLSAFTKVEKLSALEVSVETLGGDNYHFISKRTDALIKKLTLKMVGEGELPEILPTKSHQNSSALYDSKQGYMPTFPSSREVAHIPDYMAMDELNLCAIRPALLENHRHPPAAPSRLPPTLPYNGSSQAASTTVHAINQFYPRQPLPAPDYIPMDQHCDSIQDDYLTMDDVNRNSVVLPEPADINQEYQDPLIVDYLDMDTISNSLNQHFDDYPASERHPDVGLEQEEDEDLYFDPCLMPPPLPPRVEDKLMIAMPPRVELTVNAPPSPMMIRPGHSAQPPYREVELRQRPEAGQTRRMSEQPRPLSRILPQDDDTVNQMRPALPPKTEKDQLRVTPRPKKKNKKRPKSTPIVPRFETSHPTEETPSSPRISRIKSPLLPPRNAKNALQPRPPVIPRRS